jgi:hypothetical protein
MRTLLTMVAGAALLTGASIANAQSNPNNMVTGMTKNAAFCGQSNKGAEKDCRFTTMAACEKEYKHKAGGNCIPNSKLGTTGAASGMKSGVK